MVLKLPEGENVDFRAGGYVQLEAPKYNIKYSGFDIPEEYRGDWERFKFFDLEAKNDEEVIRAYSMANYPEEKGILKFNIRIATKHHFRFSFLGEELTKRTKYGDLVARLEVEHKRRHLAAGNLRLARRRGGDTDVDALAHL